jgi:protoheme IX farnesyltransferase
MIITEEKPTTISASVNDYWQLLKPRVMSLVIFTGFCGLWMAPGHTHPILEFTAILCIALGAGAAGCLNMWYERDLDKQMIRTMNRPTASGIIHQDSALAFGVILSILSVTLMQVAVNSISALLLALTIIFYIGIYTILLKPNTPQNIVIGGIAGALPPVIGWSAVSPLDWQPWSLFLIILLWTPAHFWALALNHKEEYEKVGLPMMPNIAGIKKTKKLIVLYAILTVISTTPPYLLDMAGTLYLFSALAFGVGFIYLTMQLYKNDNSKEGLRVFAYSILYLFILFALLIVDKKEIYG